MVEKIAAECGTNFVKKLSHMFKDMHEEKGVDLEELKEVSQYLQIYT